MTSVGLERIEDQLRPRPPAEIISHGVWLYYRVCLSSRDVEELLFIRGVIVSYEAIRKWCHKVGQQYANQLRRRRPQPDDQWHPRAAPPR
jgi:putative transposase